MVLALKDTADFPIPTKNIVDNDVNFNYATSGSINAYDRTYLDIINANRTKFFPYDKVVVERSTDSGSTWTTLSTSDFSNANRGNLMSDVGTNLYIGVGNAALTQQLRVTLQFPGTAYYCSLDRAFFRFSNSGHACAVTIEASTYGAQSTYTTLASNQTVAGWPGNNMVKFSERSAWGTNNSNHLYNIRFIFKYTSINSSYPTNQGNIQKIDMFGQNFWGTSNSPQHYGHLYSWDYLKNVTFPATLTATTLKTGTAADDHLLARRIRGDNNGTTYYHAIDMGYAHHDRCDFYEYGGVWNFWRNQSSAATTDTNNLALGITLNNVKNKSYTYTWPNKSGTIALTSDTPPLPNNIAYIGSEVAGGGALIQTSDIANGAITTDKIADGAVTPAKLGDTGWIDASSQAGLEKCYYRKIGNIVYVILSSAGNKSIGASYTTVFTLPVGFRPSMSWNFVWQNLSSADARQNGWINPSGTIELYSNVSKSYWYGSTSFPVD